MISNTKTHLPPAAIEDIMHAHFGADTVISRIEEMTEGWFNAVYLVYFAEKGTCPFDAVVLKTGVQDHKYVIRYEKEIMKTELKVYDRLADTSVPVPQILIRDFSQTLVDCNYFIMELVGEFNWNHVAHDLTKAEWDGLLAEFAGYVATIGQQPGEWFGYIKDDPFYQHESWREAFSHMFNFLIEDGIRGDVDLPYAAIRDALEPLWPLMDEVREARLVHFDLWAKNIMLSRHDGTYKIEAFIDMERAFYGDPYAEFVACEELCGPIDACAVFQEHYSAVTGEPFTFTLKDRIRVTIYELYLATVMGVEVYRYNEEDTLMMLTYCRAEIAKLLDKLADLSARLETAEAVEA